MFLGLGFQNPLTSVEHGGSRIARMRLMHLGPKSSDFYKDLLSIRRWMEWVVIRRAPKDKLDKLISSHLQFLQ